MTNNINIASKTKILSICLQSTVTLLTGVLGAHALSSARCGGGTETRKKEQQECSHIEETRPCNKGPCQGELEYFKNFFNSLICLIRIRELKSS